MDNTSQIELPDTFMRLFLRPGQTKPKLGWEHVFERYELCEDMAVVLQHNAQRMLTEQFLSAEIVLQRCCSGLLAQSAPFTKPEAHWIVQRLGELLNCDHSDILQMLENMELEAEPPAV